MSEEVKAKAKVKKIYQAANLCKAKDGRLYIKVDKDFSAKKGQYIDLDVPKDAIMRLVEKGFIKEEEAEERIEKVAFIKYFLNVPDNS